MGNVDRSRLGQTARDGGALGKYCDSPGAQNDSFTKKVAQGILRRVVLRSENPSGRESIDHGEETQNCTF